MNILYIGGCGIGETLNIRAPVKLGTKRHGMGAKPVNIRALEKPGPLNDFKGAIGRRNLAGTPQAASAERIAL